MLLNNIFLVSMGKTLLLWFILYLSRVLVNYFQEYKKKQYGTLEELKLSRIKAQIYLDQYYITNKYYTFSMMFISVFSTGIIFIIIQHIIIDPITFISSQVYLFLPFILIGYFIIIMITITLYKSLLMTICKKELNKIYLYFDSFNIMFKKRLFGWSIIGTLKFRLSRYIFGYLFLLTYKIGTLTYRYPHYIFNQNLTLIESMYINADIFDNESDYVIKNTMVISWAYKSMELSRKYNIIRKTFIIFAYICRFLYKHASTCYKAFLYFTLVSSFIISLYNKEFHSIYILILIYIIIKTKKDFTEFIDNRDGLYDYYLTQYFYKNQIDYKDQRIYLYSKDNTEVLKYFSSESNDDVFRDLKDIIEYTYTYNFTCKYSNTIYKIKRQRKIKGMYRRFWILVSYIIILYYIMFHTTVITISLIILLVLIVLSMVYTHYYTFHSVIAADEDKNYIENDKEIYDKKYNIMFWTLTIILAYIYWLLLMDTEILLQLAYNIIVNTYTTDEKILYLYNYFDYYLSTINLELKEKEYLRYIIRKIDFVELINNNPNLKDVKVYIKLIVDNYMHMKEFDIMVKSKIEVQSSWHTFFTNIVSIIIKIFTW